MLMSLERHISDPTHALTAWTTAWTTKDTFSPPLQSYLPPSVRSRIQKQQRRRKKSPELRKIDLLCSIASNDMSHSETRLNAPPLEALGRKSSAERQFWLCCTVPVSYGCNPYWRFRRNGSLLISQNCSYFRKGTLG